jgi:hypothetical protein
MNKINDVNMARRSGIIIPIKEPSNDKCSCVVCKNDSLNASGICVLCNRFICNSHTIIIDDIKYCSICKNSDNYKPLINALSQHMIIEEKRCCVIS